jgi:hypothetical protein
MTSQGSAQGPFLRAIQRRNLFQAELAMREMGTASLLDALAYLDLLADQAGETRSRGDPVAWPARNRISLAHARRITVGTGGLSEPVCWREGSGHDPPLARAASAADVDATHLVGLRLRTHRGKNDIVSRTSDAKQRNAGAQTRSLEMVTHRSARISFVSPTGRPLGHLVSPKGIDTINQPQVRWQPTFGLSRKLPLQTIVFRITGPQERKRDTEKDARQREHSQDYRSARRSRAAR